VQDTNHVSSEDVLLRESLRNDIQQALSLLAPREATIIILRYGLDQSDEVNRNRNVSVKMGRRKGLSLAGVAAKMDLSRERVRQIERRAMLKLGAMKHGFDFEGYALELQAPGEEADDYERSQGAHQR
jgi:RNA polymerase nonessential primary-like sigma factor